MGKKSLVNKILSVMIIMFYIITIIIPAISGFNTDIDEKTMNRSKKILKENERFDVKFYSFGLDKSITTDLQMTQTQVDELFDKLQQYTILSADNTQPQKTQQLKEEIIQIAQVEDLIPANMKNKLLAENNPYPNVGFKKSIINSPPHTQTKASALLCNFATTGMGTQFPVLIFPRLIPVLLMPIPRVFFRWNAVEAVTSCGSYLTGTGYIAYGPQTGNALGFWGIGFSLFLPPIMNYAFIGYAVYSSVDAEIIEPWPPNYPPVISAVYPPDNGFNIPISTSQLKFSIRDQNKDLMNYSVTTDPYIGSGMGEQVSDGTYSIPISGLEGTEDYSWKVSVFDGMKSSIETFTFATEPTAPVVLDPVPSDDEKYVSVSLSELSFKISDPQGDFMDYTIETVPDIGSGSGTGVSGGIYSVDVSNIDYSSEYLWFVNVTDGENWKHKVFSFQTEPEMIFDPFAKGWSYRKKITIDHNLVDSNLEDFPVLISTIDADLKLKAQDDGDDILFMDNVGETNRLFHEVEEFDDDTGNLVAWVNIPFLDSSIDTEFYMYYGNPDSCNQQTVELVWDENYIMVQHMKDDPDNYHIKDSTFNENHGVKTAGNQPIEITEGNLGFAQHFDGINDLIYVDNIGSIVNTFNIWLKPDDPIDYDQNHMDIIEFTTQEFRIVLGCSYASISIQDVIPPDPRTNVEYCLIDEASWHMLTLVWNVNDYHYDVYFDGEIQTVESLNDHVSKMNCGDFIAGGIPTSQYYYNGVISEIRISDVIKSPTWISTEFSNQNNPSDFYTVGPEEI